MEKPLKIHKSDKILSIMGKNGIIVPKLLNFGIIEKIFESGKTSIKHCATSIKIDRVKKIDRMKKNR